LPVRAHCSKKIVNMAFVIQRIRAYDLSVKNKDGKRIKMPDFVKNYKACDQGFKCNACDRSLEHNLGEVDHIIGLKYGGSNQYYNLEVVHGDCHNIKSAFHGNKSKTKLIPKTHESDDVWMSDGKNFKHAEVASWNKRLVNLFVENKCDETQACILSMAKFIAFCEEKRTGLSSKRNNYEKLLLEFIDAMIEQEEIPWPVASRIVRQLEEFCQLISHMMNVPPNFAMEISEIRTAIAIHRNKYPIK